MISDPSIGSQYSSGDGNERPIRFEGGGAASFVVATKRRLTFCPEIGTSGTNLALHDSVGADLYLEKVVGTLCHYIPLTVNFTDNLS